MRNQQEQIWDDWFQAELKKTKSRVTPPCPPCGGVMKTQDAWITTVATCTACGWNYSEGL